MIGVITGDVINSRSKSPEIWLNTIKETLKKNKIPKRKWDIFRGDMFQIEVEVIKILALAIELKAAIKEDKYLDLRMSIGIGAEEYTANNVLESNGEAYINSGEEFEILKKTNLKIKTPWKEFNDRWNMIFGIALLTMDNWAPITAEIIKTTLQSQNKTQKEIARILGKSPSSISEGLSRAGHDEIKQMISQFNKEILNKNAI